MNCLRGIGNVAFQSSFFFSSTTGGVDGPAISSDAGDFTALCLASSIIARACSGMLSK